jgi:hypothetical protein
MLRIIAISLSLVFLLISCSSLKQESKDIPAEIKIDGRADEWKQSFTFYEKNLIYLAVANDQENLYICLKANDQNLIKQVPRTGLTLWVDQDGGSDRVLGVKFPVGLVGEGMDREELRRMRDQSPEEKKEFLMKAMDEIVIIRGEEKEKVLMSLAKHEGVEAAFDINRFELLYEIKIPINGNHFFNVNLNESKTISIGFETTEFKKLIQDMQIQGGFSGGMGGGRAGMSGGRGGMGGRGMSQRPEIPDQFKFWIDLELK